MTHFLARLIERARGSAPQVEPLIAPRFAPAPVTEIATEVEAPAHPVVRQEIASRRGEEIPPEEKIAPGPEQLLVPQETVEARPSPAIVRRIGPEEIAPPAKGHGAGSTMRPGSLRPATRNAVAGGVDPGTPSAVRAPHRAPTRSNESHIEPPIVRVTIGRIDVRAAPPSAPPARKSSPRSQPKLTLDRYLQSRKEECR